MNENWTEIRITVPSSKADLAGDIANMTVPYGIYIEDYSNLEDEAMKIAHIDLIDEELLAKDRAHAIVHIYISQEDNPAEVISFLEERFLACDIAYSIDCADCVIDDWLNNWKKYFKPVPIGQKLLIRPIWETDFNPMGRAVLNLEPGLAFGTGTHETTRLCLEFIEENLSPGSRFLDMGCGSGILSVAALLLGAESAVGIDIDPLAVKTAQENARLNKMEKNFTGICGNLAEKVTGQYQMITANIVADVVIQLTKDVPQFLAPGGIYIISGIIDTREQDVLDALQDRFTVVSRKEDHGWIAMALSARRDIAD
ncbi:50S ribosomal protein L11 methyltransferase [Acutalibacter sp. 1XD8-33]|uniref:50S ribosomal protein L11 methyltransferase n=1 Tax=Acutalibacter sp. 1XD8-33 TaxID=2320081 RepID=UPI000EA3DC2E|nr:50S ribosomal protein L11 methyltransferase [Acutalibacter sp. 1XD8-33]RKJ40327.1 50S ribosomal protein L11 methyltransferase [Acutalibacter sp. 1XD8-33]